MGGWRSHTAPGGTDRLGESATITWRWGWMDTFCSPQRASSMQKMESNNSTVSYTNKQINLHLTKKHFSPLENIFVHAHMHVQQFWTSGSAQTRKTALSLSSVFWLGHFLRSKIVFKSSFYTKSYIYNSKFFWSG